MQKIDTLLNIVRSGNQKLFEEFIKSLIFAKRFHVVTSINGKQLILILGWRIKVIFLSALPLNRRVYILLGQRFIK